MDNNTPDNGVAGEDESISNNNMAHTTSTQPPQPAAVPSGSSGAAAGGGAATAGDAAATAGDAAATAGDTTAPSAASSGGAEKKQSEEPSRVVPAHGMTSDEFRKRGKEMIDWIADYHDNIEQHRVRSAVEPGYLVSALPETAPEEPEQWESIMGDVDKLIMPGVSHWQSPRMFAYFPASTSYPALMGDMLSGVFGMIGFSWINGPALTELENVCMNWLRQMLRLPDYFTDNGVIQGSASDAVLVAVLSARERALAETSPASSSSPSSSSGEDTNLDGEKTIAKLVAYCSNQAHSSIDKACKLAGIVHTNVRVIPTITQGPDFLQLDAKALEEAITKDKAAGLIPFFVSTSLGTTATTACDDLAAVGAVCERANASGGYASSRGCVWMHVDAAYAGTALICEEFDWMRAGMEYADSFNFNPHKWMLVNFDCSAMWVRDRAVLNAAMASKPFEIYNNDASSSGRVIDYKDWQVPLGRRFRALKLWMVIRTYGVSGLKAHVRRHVHQAKIFDELVVADDRFEVSWPTRFGLVCFSVKVTSTSEDANALNLKLLDQLNLNGDVWLVHSAVEGRNFLRLALCSPQSEERHMHDAFQSVVTAYTQIVDV